jgi:hypothetical protein
MGEIAVDAQKLSNMEMNQSALIAENEQLREHINKLSSGKLIYSKMLAVKKDFSAVGKDQKNTFQGFKFRGIDQFINALKPILDKHGVGLTTQVQQSSEEYKTNDKGKTSKNVRIIMNYTFFAEDGSTISSSIPAEGIDTSDKATNKALSAAFKYMLIQTFAVPTEDMAIPDSESVQINGEKLQGSGPKKVVKAASKDEAKTPSKSFRKPKVVAEVEEEEDDL